MIPDPIRLADPVKIAAINATLLGIWVAVAALRLSRAFDSLREASKHERSLFSVLKEAEQVELGLGMVPPDLIYSAPQDFRIRAAEFERLILSRSVTTTTATLEESARFLQLMSALSNQYPFAARVAIDARAVRYSQTPTPLFTRFDRGAIERWILDVSWLAGKVGTPIGLFPRRAKALMDPTVRNWHQVTQLMRGSLSTHLPALDLQQDFGALLNRIGPGFGELPVLLAKQMCQHKYKSLEIKRLLLDIDYSRGSVPSGRLVVLLSSLAVVAFICGVIYPLMACSGVLVALDCACQSSILFSVLALIVPWCFYFFTAFPILFWSLRQSRSR